MMTSYQSSRNMKPSKALHVALWAVQILLGLMFLAVGAMKTTQPIASLATALGWPEQVPTVLVRFIGVAEFLGGLGLILPAATRIKPVLTPLAGTGLATAMLFAMIFHISRGEFRAMPLPFVLLCLAMFVAWGRGIKIPIANRNQSRSGAPGFASPLRTTATKTLLLLATLLAPITMHAFDRGTVERFATLPAGTGHPEGICTDGDGNVYVATVDVPKPDRKNGTLIVFDANGKYLRTIRVANSSTMLLDIRFHPQTGKLIVVDYGAAKLLTVDPTTGDSSVFMTVTADHPGLDAFCFDAAGNVYTTDAHQGIIWKVGKDGGAGSIFVQDALLKPSRPPPIIGANGVWLNNKQDAMFVANTAQDTLVKIPVSGEPLKPGKPEVFVNRVGGGPDGILIDEHDNIWIACNQANEVLVVEPKEGRAIAKLGDFGGIDKDGAPIGLLWSNTLCFRRDDVLVTNLSLNVAAVTSPSLRTVDGPWADKVKLHTVSKIKKQIPSVPQ